MPKDKLNKSIALGDRVSHKGKSFFVSNFDFGNKFKGKIKLSSQMGYNDPKGSRVNPKLVKVIGKSFTPKFKLTGRNS